MRSFMLSISAMLLAVVLVAPASAAHLDVVIVSPDDLAGWGVQSFSDGDIPFAFTDGPATTGDGSLQFGPIANAGADARDKLIVGRELAVPTADFDGLSYDFYIDPGAANTDSRQYYLNVYVNVDGTGPAFYDCRYDYVPAAGLPTGWNTLAIDGDTVATAGGNNASYCDDTINDTAGTIFLVTLNAGDTSAADTGLAGGFDTVIIGVDGGGTLYDFEAAANVPASKNDCKKGGWADLERLDRTVFKNQGDCIQYFNTGK